MIKFISRLNVQVVENNPECIFVFGDNLIGKGKAGQAIIRDCSNAFGVPTKRLPSMNFNAFFSDTQQEYDIVKDKLIQLWNWHLQGKCIVFPNNVIGSGLAKTASKSPIIWKLINKFYDSCREANID